MTLAFDVYGTLFDTQGVTSALATIVGDRAAPFAQFWREKQLEYTFRRGLMHNYVDFETCVAQSLAYASRVFGVSPSPENEDKLMARFAQLPLYADAEQALTEAQMAGFRMYAFSNGSADAVSRLLETGDIREYFDDIISCEELKSYKPNPAVYAYFLRRADATGSEAWLVSANCFDVLGAVSAGMRGAWVQRSADMVCDPWEVAPTITADSLIGLAEMIAAES